MTDLALNIVVRTQQSGGSVLSVVKNDISSVELALRGMGTQSSQTSGLFSSLIGVAGRAAGALLNVGVSAAETGARMAVGFGAQSVQAAGDYQKSMLQVQALAGVSAKDANAASQAIMDMSTKVGQSPKTLADGLYYIASAGYSAKDSLTLLDLSSRAAAVGNTTTEITANSLTAAMKAFNIPASQAAQVMDIMTKTVSTGKTEFADYATVIGKVSINAKQANVSFTEANAAFATLTNVMPSSKQAADSLNALLQTSSRIDLLTARADRLGISFNANAYQSMNFAQRMQYLLTITHGNQEAMTTLLGRQNAVAAATILGTNHFKDYNDALQNITNSSGALNTAFATTSQGFDFQMKQLSASLDVLKITLGSALLPVLNQLLSHIMPLVQQFTQWVTQNHIADQIAKALGNTITFLWNAFQSLLPTLRQLWAQAMQMVGAFIQWIQKNDVLAQVMHIVMQAGQLLWETLRTAMPVLGNLFLQLMPIISGLLQWAINNNILGTAITAIGGVLTLLLQAVTVILPPILNAITGFINWITQSGLLQGALSLASQGVQGLGNWINQTLPGLAGWTNQTKQAADAVNNLGKANGTPTVPGGGTGGKGGGKSGSNLVGGFASGDFGGPPPQLNWWQQFVQTVQGLWGQLTGFIGSRWSNAWSGMTKDIQPIIPQLKQLEAAVVGFFLTIAQYAASFWNNLGAGFVQAVADLGIVGAGLVQFFAGLGALIVDMFMLHFGKLNSDLQVMWQGLMKIIQGIWAGILALGHAFSQSMSDLWNHFIDDLLKNTQKLADQLVGHSIIPDMCRAILQWFTNLGPNVITAVQNMINNIVNKFNSFLSQATQFGKNVVQNVINGIGSMMGNLGQAASNIASTIKSYLPHSPAEKGPLQNVDKFMPSFIAMLSSQLSAGAPQIAASATALVTPLAQPLQGTAPRGNSGSGGNVFNITIQVDGRSAKTDTDLVNMVSDKLGKQLLRSGLMLPTAKGL